MNKAKAPISRRKAWLFFFAITCGIVVGDLFSKEAIFGLLEVVSAGNPLVVRHQNVVKVIPNFFELEATYNRGAFYGIFAEHTGVLALLSAVAVFVIASILHYSLKHSDQPSLWFVIALALICGGTLGNLYDRFVLGAVRDWVKWFFVWDGNQKVWPNFNIADSGICVGVSILIFLEFRNALRERRKRKREVVEAGQQEGLTTDNAEKYS